jgi:hypothetical protein
MVPRQGSMDVEGMFPAPSVIEGHVQRVVGSGQQNSLQCLWSSSRVECLV